MHSDNIRSLGYYNDNEYHYLDFNRITPNMDDVALTKFILYSEFNEQLDFTASPTNCTVPCDVSFTGSTNIGNIQYWKWDFGEGAPVIGGQYISHTYNTSGTYTVNCTIYDGYSNYIREKANYITVTSVYADIIISGTAYENLTQPIPYVTITYTGTTSSGSTSTNISGYYSFTVASGWSGTITAQKEGYSFPSPLYLSDVTSNLNYQDFYGSQIPDFSFTASADPDTQDNNLVANANIYFTPQDIPINFLCSWDFGDDSNTGPNVCT